MKAAKWILIGVGILFLLLGCISLENKPDRMYATKSYGRGIVHEKNTGAKVLKYIGFGCIGVGALWVWAESGEKK